MMRNKLRDVCRQVSPKRSKRSTHTRTHLVRKLILFFQTIQGLFKSNPVKKEVVLLLNARVNELLHGAILPVLGSLHCCAICRHRGFPASSFPSFSLHAIYDDSLFSRRRGSPYRVVVSDAVVLSSKIQKRMITRQK